MDEVVLRAIDLGSPLLTAFAHQQDHCRTT
jgi:hypothetical protein